MVVYMPRWTESAKPARRRQEGRLCLTFSPRSEIFCHDPTKHSATRLPMNSLTRAVLEIGRRALASVGAELLALLHGGTASSDERLLM